MIAAVLFALSTALLPTRASQAPQDPVREAPAKLEAWPKPARELETQIKTDVDRLRAARTEEMVTGAEDGLLAANAAAVPALLAALGKEQDVDARKRIEKMLTRLTGEEHTRLLAAEFVRKEPAVRHFALTRCAAFPDPALRPKAEAALTAAKKANSKDELFAASLCASSSGSLLGLDTLFEIALSSWGKRAWEIRRALEGVRTAPATQHIAAKLKPGDAALAVGEALKSPDRQRIVAVLNLLAGCGDASAKPVIRPFLDSNDNSVRVAAINSALGVLDQAPPVVDLPVFEAIELAKKLKERL